MGIVERKHALRREIKERIKNLSFEEREKKSRALSEVFHSLLNSLFNSSNNSPDEFVLGVYAPLLDEANVLVLGESLKRLAFPDIEEGQMIFRECQNEELLESKVFGVRIKTPPESAPKVVPDMILVPGLGFSKEGHRLGRGKGFYDRFLKNFEGLTVGVAFDEQIEADIPHEDHDVPVQYVVSESGIYGNIK